MPVTPVKPSMPSATPYSVTEVPRIGISPVAATAACRAGVALHMMRSTLSETKVLAMVAQFTASPEAFFSSKITSGIFSESASLKPWVAWSRASC